MTNEQKGIRYDDLIREGYVLQNKISTLKSDVFKAQTPTFCGLNKGTY